MGNLRRVHRRLGKVQATIGEEMDHVDTEGDNTHTLKRKTYAGDPAMINQARGALADIRQNLGRGTALRVRRAGALNPHRAYHAYNTNWELLKPNSPKLRE